MRLLGAAPRAEIDTAIELLFKGGAPVAINVLTWAAVDVLRGVAESLGVRTFQGTLEERIKPEALREWRRIMRNHHNFFKHADRDPDATAQDFMPEATTYPLFGVCADYQSIYQAATFPMLAYMSWFMARHPSFMLPDVAEQVASLSENLDHPEGKPFEASLRRVAENYTLALQHPEILEAFAAQMGTRFEA